MSITFIGVVIFLLGAVFAVFSQRRLLQAMVFFGSFSGTATITFPAFGVSPDAILFGYFLGANVLTMRWLQRSAFSRDHVFLVVLLVVLAITTLALMLFNGGFAPIESFQYTQLMYLQFGIAVTIALSFALATPERIDDAVGALRAGATFIACWGILQAACFYSGIPYPDFLFNNSTSHFADMFDQRAGNLIRIASVAVEPSFLAVALMIFGSFGATLLLVDPRFRTRGMVVQVALTLLVVLASTSSVGYFGIAVLACLLGLRRPGAALLGVLIAGSGLAAAVVLLPSFGAALYGVTLGKSDSVSYLERTTSMVVALDMFWRSPWVGWGWGSNPTFNLLLYWLANTGLIGTSTFLFAWAATLGGSMLSRSKNATAGDWKLRGYAMGLENAFMVNFAMSVASGFRFVVADFWIMWALMIAVASCLRLKVIAARPAQSYVPAVAFQGPGNAVGGARH